MTIVRGRFAGPLLALLLCLASPAVHAVAELSKISEGVYAFMRTEPPGLTFISNTVFIINEEDVVVIDTGIGPSVAAAAIEALKKLTTHPVKYVVNTHWHDDHMMGNQAWREAFPGAEFIAHENAEGELLSTGAANRKQLIEQGPAFARQIREAMGRNENLAGKPISNEERLSYSSDLVWADRYFAEAPNFTVVRPTQSFDKHLRLVRGTRVIDLRYLGRGHTAADIVVHLPKENILITGDLVVWPIPLFGTTSFPVDYVATLESMLALKAAVLVPGHGPVMRDDSFVRSMVELLKSIDSQTRAAFARGESLELARKSVRLEEFRTKFAGDSALRGFLFDSYVTGPGVARAYQQISGKLP